MKKLRDLLSSRLKGLRRRLAEMWGKIKEERQKEILDTVESVLNYALNSLMLSIPFFLVSVFVFEDRVPFWAFFVFLWFFLPYMEHYYRWFRLGWKG